MKTKRKNKKNFTVIFFVSLSLLLCFGVYAQVVHLDFRVLTSKLGNLSKPVCKDCNVVLVTMDLCAAHNMPCYGYDRQTTPNLCQFGKDNIFFQNAYANSPVTLQSHASIFTGLYPSNHGIVSQESRFSEKI